MDLNHVRLTIFPDGGVSRLRVYGFIKDPKSFEKSQDIPLLLCRAAMESDVVELSRLVNVCEADINSSDYDCRTALHVAASEGNLKVVQWLVYNGASYTLKDRWGNTATDDAKRGKFQEIVDFLASEPKVKDPALRQSSSVRL